MRRVAENDEVDGDEVVPGGAGDGAEGPRKRGFGTYAILGAIVMVVLAGAYLVPKPGDNTVGSAGTGAVQVSTAPGGKAPVVGQPMGDFVGTTIDGKRLSLEQFRGKPVWLTFGATWCAPCRVEAPDMEAAYQRHKENGTEILAVYMSEDAGQVSEYTGRVGMTFAHIPDPQAQLASSYQTVGIPTHFFIDRQGVLRKTHVGILTPDQMDASLDAIA